MSLCKVVSNLAKELRSQLCNLDQEHLNMLNVMEKMPEYLARNDLAEWEAEYRKATPIDVDETCENYQIIDMLYELAGFNLFGLFQQDKTKEIYSWLVSQLKNRGIKVKGGLDVSTW